MKLTTLSRIAAGVTVLTAVTAPFIALAQPTLTDYQITDFSRIQSFGNKVGSWMLGILLVVGVIFVIYAAFLYLTSGGEEEKVKKAKNFIIYAIIAIIVGVLAKTIIGLAQGLAGEVGTP
jgi:hypothetical protein